MSAFTEHHEFWLGFLVPIILYVFAHAIAGAK